MFLNITIVGYINFALIIAVIIIAYRYIESFWSYRISKPYKWEQSIKNRDVSKTLKNTELRYDDKVRFYNFWFQIERINKSKIKGDFAELGVHKGHSAKVIHQMSPNRKLYLFDTFKGFTESDLRYEKQNERNIDSKMFSDTSLERVRSLLGDSEKIVFHAGSFPETTKGLEDTEFAFVNIDADLYAPTISGLRFFYPRLAPEGVIIVHDFNHNWEGIKRALEEFSITIPEALIEVPDSNGSVMIVKNRSAV